MPDDERSRNDFDDLPPAPVGWIWTLPWREPVHPMLESVTGDVGVAAYIDDEGLHVFEASPDTGGAGTPGPVPLVVIDVLRAEYEARAARREGP